jgi:hypothetical protein
MPEFAKEVLFVNLEDEMRRSYLDYAMSVIVGELCRTCATAQTGSSPRSVCHERTRERLEQALQKIGPRGR